MDAAGLRLITRDNGVGLTRDLRLVRQSLHEAGYRCEQAGYGKKGIPGRLLELGLWTDRLVRGQRDVQIFIERVYRRCLPLGKVNILIPNPEWLLHKWRPLLPRFDLVLCKTRHAERIFRELGCRTEYIGFTSEDRLDPSVERVPEFFHLAGASTAKGTDVLLDTWRRHPEWTRLTVVQSDRTAKRDATAGNIRHLLGYIDDEHLRRLQNRHQFHLCPSEVEGFGHHLMEAMSVGAVVLATDAAPMNEHVSAERGLLMPALPSARKGLAQCWRVEAAATEQAVERALAMSAEQLSDMGHNARQHYVVERRRFHVRLRDAIGRACGETGMARAA